MLSVRIALVLTIVASTPRAWAESTRVWAVTAPPVAKDPCPQPPTRGWAKLATGGPIAPVGNMTARLDGAKVIVEGGDKTASLDVCHDRWAAGVASTPPSRPNEHNDGGWIALGRYFLLPGYDPSRSGFDAFDTARLQLPNGKTVRVSATNAPSPRGNYAIAMTGTKVIIWGGLAPQTKGGAMAPLADGAVLDLTSRTWRRIAPRGAPSARFAPSVVWTGSQLVIWGGAASLDVADLLGDGAIYDLKRDRWTPIAATGAPSARWRPIVVWTGRAMLVMGGGSQRPQNPGGANDRTDAAILELSKNEWHSIANVPALPEEHWVRPYVDGSDRVLFVDTLQFNVHQLELATHTFVDPKMDKALADRSGVATTWTGRRLVIYGGYRQAPGYKNPCANKGHNCLPPTPPRMTFSEGWVYVP